MQGKWKAWEHSAVNTAELPPLLTPREHTPHRACTFVSEIIRDWLTHFARK